MYRSKLQHAHNIILELLGMWSSCSLIKKLSLFFLRCGIALDGWMVPFPEDFLEGLSVTQPLLFINSYSWQWKENIQSMMKLIRLSEEKGNSSCSIITLKYAPSIISLNEPTLSPSMYVILLI